VIGSRILSAPRAAILGAALLAAAVFAPTVGFDFTNWDDTDYVVANPVLLSGKLLRLLNPATTTADAWTPLTIASYAIERSIGGLEPALYHATNVGLHALCTAAVAALLLGAGLSPWGAFVGAGLFAVHPLQVESVAWVAGRKSLLSTLFLLLALFEFRRDGARGVVLGTLLGGAALLAKPTAVVVVPLVLLDRLRAAPRGLGVSLVRVAPLAVLSLAIGLLAVHQQEAARADLASVPLLGRILTMGQVSLAYARHLILPIGLAAHYPIAATTGAGLGTIVVVLSGVGGFLAGGWLLRRDPAALFLLAWVPVAGFPHSNLIAGPFWMADRYAYLPLVGVCGLVGLGVSRLASREGVVRWATAVGVAFALVVLSAISVERSRVWRSSFALWEDTLGKAPAFAEGHLNLGTAYAQEDRHEEAAAAYRRALEIRPAYEAANTSLANELDTLGRREDAMRLYARSLELDPDSAAAHYNLGLVLQEEGRLEEARAHYVRTVAQEPGNWLAWNNLGNTLRALGLGEEALEAYGRALDANPGYAPTWINLGDTFRRAGRLNEAEPAYRRAIRAEPESAQAHYGLAALHAARGELLLAREQLLRVLTLDPDLEVARRSLAQVEALIAGSAPQ
jgi:Tfp pilus assembly protein PilF